MPPRTQLLASMSSSPSPLSLPTSPSSSSPHRQCPVATCKYGGIDKYLPYHIVSEHKGVVELTDALAITYPELIPHKCEFCSKCWLGLNKHRRGCEHRDRSSPHTPRDMPPLPRPPTNSKSATHHRTRSRPSSHFSTGVDEMMLAPATDDVLPPCRPRVWEHIPPSLVDSINNIVRDALITYRHH